MPPQRPPGLKTVGPVPSPLDITPIFASSIPQFGCQSPLIYVAPSILDPRTLSLTPPSTRLLSRFSPTRLTFALGFVTIAALVSVLLNVSKTLSIHERKLRSSATAGTRQRLRATTSARAVHASRFRFDPGGLALVFDPAHEGLGDAHQRKSKTRYGFVTTCNVTSPTSILPTISSFSTLKLRVFLEEA